MQPKDKIRFFNLYAKFKSFVPFMESKRLSSDDEDVRELLNLP